MERGGLYPLSGWRETLGEATRWVIASTTAVSVFLAVVSLGLLDVVSGGLVGTVLMHGSLVKGEASRAMTVGIYVLSFALSVASTGVQKAVWDMVIRGKVPRGWWLGVVGIIISIAVLDTVGDVAFGAMVLAGAQVRQFPQGLVKAGLVPMSLVALWGLACLMGEFLLAALLYHLSGGDEELALPEGARQVRGR